MSSFLRPVRASGSRRFAKRMSSTTATAASLGAQSAAAAAASPRFSAPTGGVALAPVTRELSSAASAARKKKTDDALLSPAAAAAAASATGGLTPEDFAKYAEEPVFGHNEALEAQLPLPLSELGSRVFNRLHMAEHVSAEVLAAFDECQRTGKPMPKADAEALAEGLKNWALARGAVNFAHNFSPLRGSSGEKHDALIDINYGSKDQEPLVSFSATKLFQGETDGSSFPNGGLRDTHAAAAFTVWDTTSPPFVREDTLYIPTTFTAWTGQALDDKSLVLRSQDALSAQAVRLLRLLGDRTTSKVVANVGVEQEFFVVDRDHYLARPDLVNAGRTLLGALPPRNQQTSAHYFARMPLRVRDLMRDFQAEMWALGVSVSVYHNEVAPAQHEYSPIFTLASRAADQNQLSMDVLTEMAHRHKLQVLWHEKPFKGVNGSGKHCNWGLNTDGGDNLLVPGKTPAEQARFITFVAALARALDVHGDVLRCAVASAGNDHRLGANEAPPAIISLYTGSGMEEHLRAVANDGAALAGYGANKKVIPTGTRAAIPIMANLEDRNRTAPFPFCGNRFEFRAVGSAFNIAQPMGFLNTIVADSLRVLADRIEAGTPARDAVAAMLREHWRIIFNGDGYSQEWRDESARRGLWHLRTAPEALAHLDSAKNKALFAAAGVYDEQELSARKNIELERYINQRRIEAGTLLDMLRTQVVPALVADLRDNTLPGFTTGAGVDDVVLAFFGNKRDLYAEVVRRTAALEAAVAAFPKGASLQEQADYSRDALLATMDAAREVTDKAEQLVADKLWPLPKYQELLLDHHVEGEGESRSL